MSIVKDEHCVNDNEYVGATLSVGQRFGTEPGDPKYWVLVRSVSTDEQLGFASASDVCRPSRDIDAAIEDIISKFPELEMRDSPVTIRRAFFEAHNHDDATRQLCAAEALRDLEARLRDSNQTTNDAV